MGRKLPMDGRKRYVGRMCSVVILRRPSHPWPLILGANRDEMMARPWKPPGRHWPDRPDVVAGLDLTAGGSWMGLNEAGLVACVLNRENALGPQAGKRSRGELALEALDHADAMDAADALSDLNVEAYRPFNILVADNRDCFWLSFRDEPGRRRVEVVGVPLGTSLLTAADLNDEDASPRTRFYRPLFAAADAPDPDADRWTAWEELLGSRIWDGDAGPRGAMCVVTPVGFGTVCSSILALPAPSMSGTVAPVWRFAPGPPDRTPFAPLDLAPP